MSELKYFISFKSSFSLQHSVYFLSRFCGKCFTNSGTFSTLFKLILYIGINCVLSSFINNSLKGIPSSVSSVSFITSIFNNCSAILLYLGIKVHSFSSILSGFIIVIISNAFSGVGGTRISKVLFVGGTDVRTTKYCIPLHITIHLFSFILNLLTALLKRFIDWFTLTSPLL